MRTHRCALRVRSAPEARNFTDVSSPWMGVADQLLLTVVWLRHYPTQECLGYLFGASASSALRAVRRSLPVLEAAGKDSMRLPDPGKGHRRDLPTLLKETPALAVIVDTFEQRTHRPRRHQ